jgi:hypothetical protein
MKQLALKETTQKARDAKAKKRTLMVVASKKEILDR